MSIKQLPKTSQEVIKDEIKETKKILAGNDLKVDLSESGDKSEETGIADTDRPPAEPEREE